jgi:hypothetical protein
MNAKKKNTPHASLHLSGDWFVYEITQGFPQCKMVLSFNKSVAL